MAKLSALQFTIFIFIAFGCVTVDAFHMTNSSQNEGNPFGMLTKRIIGGTNARVGEFPWLVSIMIRQNPQTYRQMQARGRNAYMTWLIGLHHCGGTLISPNWVLTAAHCFDGGGANRPHQYAIRLGEHDITNENVPHVEIIPARIFIFNRYRTFGDEGDIALIKLQRSAPIGKNIGIGRLASQGQQISHGTRCVAMGWGREYVGSQLNAAVLRHVSIHFISSDRCMKLYAGIGKWNYYLQRGSLICAASNRNGLGVCYGDSGGPLLCKTSGGWLVMGLVSTGQVCGSDRYPGLYTTVPKFMPWIRRVTSSN